MALEDDDFGKVGQDKIIAVVRRLVDRWRGFPLGSAREPFPDVLPRYEPAEADERQVSDTTMGLLQHWFRREPHLIGRDQEDAFKYWPHQRRTVETFIYLHEVRGVRRTEQLWQLAGVAPLANQRDPWPKIGGQLATGSGKTKMMSLLVAWWYLNAVRERGGSIGAGRHAILIAPGLFVRDRLFQDFFPPAGGAPVFTSDPVVPPSMESDWRLRVYSPTTCPLRLDPDEGALVVTNFHQLLRTRNDEDEGGVGDSERRKLALLFSDDEPAKLEAIDTPLVDRFARSRGLLVLNDEAHHVWDETGHARFEERAKERAQLGKGESGASDMAWIRSIRRLHGASDASGRVGLQVDMSATLFEETGAEKTTKGGKTTTEFKPADLFRHTAVQYGLADAIRDGIVKRPVLEQLKVRNKQTGERELSVRKGQPNAWETYRNLLVTGIERWKNVKSQLEDEGDRRKPIMFILCSDKSEAREVANYLTYGEATKDDLSGRPPTGYRDGATSLFVDKGADGVTRSTVIEIHIGEKEERNEADWERVRQAVNAIDRDELPDPAGRKDAHGAPIMVPNPYNVVVSVMMLKEGWDVRNVKVIVPLRPCDSRTLTEQTLGRGLRKMYPPIIDEDGGADLAPEDLFVIEHESFGAIIGQIDDLVERKEGDEITHARDYVAIVQKDDEAERLDRAVRLVRFEGTTEIAREWHRSFDVERVPALVPRVPWLGEIGETEIQTYLKRAMETRLADGLEFTVSELPSYRDFDQVIEGAYARPILHDLKLGHVYKNAVKTAVKEYLEQRVFALPDGVPVSFALDVGPELARIALANLARPEVIEKVRAALRPALAQALAADRRSTVPFLTVRSSAELPGFPARRKNVLETPAKTNFVRAAMENPDEYRIAQLLEQADDVTSWVYNHRSGVKFAIAYDWLGFPVRYFPDFIARVQLGQVTHNVIIEMKGRLDDRDKEKARQAQRHCEMLTDNDIEPWHYLLLIENNALGRHDVGWWANAADKSLRRLLARHESIPLIPPVATEAAPVATVVASVAPDEEFRSAVPVHDLAASAGAFGEEQSPTPIGWMRISVDRTLGPDMFVARVVGKSMEPGIPDGSWCLFRQYAAGEAPSPIALDGKRVVAQLRTATDPDTGGAYTLKRWRVASRDAEGGVDAVDLLPDNYTFKPLHMTPDDGDLRVIAEFLVVVG